MTKLMTSSNPSRPVWEIVLRREAAKGRRYADALVVIPFAGRRDGDFCAIDDKDIVF